MLQNLGPALRRLTAPNPGPMTGEGTNTYIVGHERVAVVDPGPAIPAHTDAILAAVGDRIGWIIVTHTHADHSPGAAALAAATGAPRLGMLSARPRFQDSSFVLDQPLAHDQLIDSDEFRLRAIHTPGHVDNHFCLLLEDAGVLMAGDHLMNGKTVVIIPPQGDMRAYIASLESLLAYDISAIAPGHGDLMQRPREVIEWTIEHRLQRERKTLGCLQQLGSATLEELVASVYDDVDASIHRVAQASLWAHLLKLETEGQVSGDGIDAGRRWRINTVAPVS